MSRLNKEYTMSMSMYSGTRGKILPMDQPVGQISGTTDKHSMPGESHSNFSGCPQTEMVLCHS